MDRCTIYTGDNFFFKIFLMWTIFEAFIEFVTILLLFYVWFFWPWGMWNLSSPPSCIGRGFLTTGLTGTSLHWWRRKWQPTPVLLPAEFHGQRSLAGCSVWGHKRVGHDWVSHTYTHTHTHTLSQALFWVLYMHQLQLILIVLVSDTHKTPVR